MAVHAMQIQAGRKNTHTQFGGLTEDRSSTAQYRPGVDEFVARAGSTGWRDLDQAPDAQAYIDYLDRAAARLHDRRLRGLTSLGVLPGNRVLDVGCGTGDSIFEFLERVQPGAQAFGVDPSDTIVQTARARAATRGLDAEFMTGSVEALKFPDGFFQAVHCTRVLMHLDDPAAAMLEMARVLSPGGRLVVWEPDWDALAFDTGDLTASRVVRDAIIARQRHPDIGRQLRRLALDRGLEILSFAGEVISEWSTFTAAEEAFLLAVAVDEAVSAGTLSAEAGEAWLSQARADDITGRFVAQLVAYQLIARK